ncbi:MAG: hypothetical protein ABIK09_17955 [Pseudomonadota bacterium]
MRRIIVWITLGLTMGVVGLGCDSGGSTGSGADAVAGEDIPQAGCEPADPCCDGGGVFLSAGETCVLIEESACSSEVCGGAPVTRQILGQCSGDLGACGGVPAPGPWSSLEICGWDAVCDAETLACVPGVCELETCGDPDVDEYDKTAPNEAPADAATVLELNPPMSPCDPDLTWTGTLHDGDDWDWYRFNIDEYQGYDCASFDPVFTFTGVPGAWVQFRCWAAGEVAEFDASEGVFDCDLVDPVTIDGVELDQALACRIGPNATFTNLRCWRADYEDDYNTAMMVLIGIGDEVAHPCANYTVAVDGASR